MDDLPRDHPAWPDEEEVEEKDTSYISAAIMAIFGTITVLVGWIILKTVQSQVLTIPPSQRPDLVCGVVWGCGYAMPSISEMIGITLLLVLFVGVLGFTGRNTKSGEE